MKIQNEISIPVLDEFLQQWKHRAVLYYNKVMTDMIPLQQEYSESINPYNNRLSLSDEERKVLESEHEAKYKKLQNYKKFHNSIVSQLYDYGYSDEQIQDKIHKILDKEVDSKKLKLIARITKKAGNITDTSYLKIGVNGEINGSIIGDIAKVRVETIYAGGVNIQCLHYRVLVK